MLSAHEVVHAYGATAVLRDVSFDLEEGAITGLIGANGAGKSTLLHIIAGLVSPMGGAVILDETERRHPRFADHIGFCPDDLPQVELLTGREYLALTAGLRRLPYNREAEAELLEGLRLQDAADRLVCTYSHGMKRKLHLIAALLHLPAVLILDEPFRGLDPESSAIMKGLLDRYAQQGNTVLVSTHDLLIAEQICDRVLVLGNGTILADAPVGALHAHSEGETLETAFLRLTGLDTSTVGSERQFFSGLAKLAPTAGAR